MEIVLVPGLWLDGSSWDQVVPALESAGHATRPITLPGMESADADRSRVSRQDCVDAIVAAIDAADGPVVLVAHSAGCGLAYAALDARPERVARAIHVGGFPTPDGLDMADNFVVENGDLPLPDWSSFDEADLRDLDDELRAQFRARAIPSPQSIATEPQRLSDDERRYAVPVTAVCPEYTSEMLRSWVDQGAEPVREFARIADVEYVDLPTGHWPQFTRPAELAQLVLDADAAAR